MSVHCVHATTKRGLAAEGEKVVFHDAKGDGRTVYATDPNDKRKGLNRQAICLDMGDQVEVLLSSELQTRLGLDQSSARCTFHGHLVNRDEFFTVNGRDNAKIFLYEVVGIEMQVFARGTEVISNIVTTTEEQTTAQQASAIDDNSEVLGSDAIGDLTLPVIRLPNAPVGGRTAVGAGVAVAG